MSVVVGDPRVGTVSLGAALDTSAQGGSALLRWSLRGADLVALLVAWSTAAALWSGSPGEHPWVRMAGVTLLLGAVGLWLINANDLYLARVATMRTVEQARIVRVAALLGLVAVVAQWAVLDSVSAGFVIAGAVLSLVALLVSRTLYRAWLTSARKAGYFTRSVLLVGLDERAAEIHRVLDEQPELGFVVVGALGSEKAASELGMAHLWRGEVDEAVALVSRGVATGAVVSSTALRPEDVNAVTRSLLDHKCHVQLSAGVTGLAQSRLRPVHVGYEPLLYVERLDFTRAQLLAKRAMDLALAAVVGVIVTPLLLLASLAIKLDDGGPILFRQRRVGRDGRLFTVLKLRTMSVDAEDRMDEVAEGNYRNGPLFKMEHDPRVTRVGRILRSLSIDELPQLMNVLRGQMSLVGPRPALPSEVEHFHGRLRERTRVLPGITGLWQVEARDNPSFHAYERLDLYYVENWSIGLDLMIVVATIENELVRLLRPRRRRLASATAQD
jgi:exopolysaccharide biosynthesis polyprenyl glycosylphosphotransferase